MLGSSKHFQHLSVMISFLVKVSLLQISANSPSARLINWTFSYLINEICGVPVRAGYLIPLVQLCLGGSHCIYCANTIELCGWNHPVMLGNSLNFQFLIAAVHLYRSGSVRNRCKLINLISTNCSSTSAFRYCWRELYSSLAFSLLRLMISCNVWEKLVSCTTKCRAYYFQG